MSGSQKRRGKAWLAGGIAGATLGMGAVLAWAADAPATAPAAKPADPKALEFFETRIRPLLSQQCFACHGGKQAQGGLKLDSAAAFMKGGPSGPLVHGADVEQSLLLNAVSYTKELKMPPAGKLKPQQIADLTAWVKMGAPWPGAVAAAPTTPAAPGQLFTPEQKAFWAFQPVREPAVPAVKNPAWVKSPIDAFVLKALEAKGLKPAPPADRRTLLRRVTFDLTGLPPTPREIDTFLSDTSPNAFAKVVDRLLASPAYGERWARHWLDVARYADSNGLDENTAFGNAWRYRDYVVRAFNEDKPYDQFLTEQLAGDLLPASQNELQNRDRLVATGFLSLGPKVLAEPDKQKMVMDIVDEQIDTTGKAFMGLTLGCARCHDHKFDPLPTRDYYGLAGIFKSTRTMKSLNTVAQVLERPIADPETLEKQKAYQQVLDGKQEELRAASHRALTEASGALLGQFDKYLLASRNVAVDLRADAAEGLDLSDPGAVVLEAEKFRRGDVTVTQAGDPEKTGYIESAGRTAAFTEYDVDLKEAGEYRLALRYASAETRPVKISLDGKLVAGRAAGAVTGGFDAGHQEWKTETTFTATPGKHVLRLDQAAGALPHVDKIALVPAASSKPVAAEPGKRTVEAAAAESGLNAEALRRTARYLARMQRREMDPIWQPWRELSTVPAERFAAEARSRIEGWRSSGALKAWNPQVAALLDGEAPKSAAELAARYKTLFQKVNAAWLRQAAARKPKTKLADSDMESLRQALYGRGSALGLDQPEQYAAAELRGSIERLKQEVAEVQKNAPTPAAMAIAVEEGQSIANQKICLRGNHITLGEEAPRQFLRIIAGEKQTPIGADRSGRLDLAQWLTRPDHPLTSRVMVNRIWQHHFGEGIVRTPDNFGKLGDRPDHPELLDWLAKRFVESGWSIKAMHRLIVLSNTYQMSTQYDQRSALADPENRLFWRFNRQRLEVEAIRDSMLAVSGKLDHTEGGTLLKTANFGYVTNDQSGNGAQYDAPRRSLYLPVIRNAVFDVFQVFDFVEPSVETGKRATTTVAPQALFLLNGQFVLNQAGAWSERLLGHVPNDADRVRVAYLQAYGRPASADEVAAAQAYVEKYTEKLEAKEPDEQKRKHAAWTSFCQILLASNEFVYVN